MKPPTIEVLGDYFIDNYWTGTATRISPEAPIPVVNISELKSFPGGAGNVEYQLQVLGAEVVGIHSNMPAIKNRLMVDGHQLARWDEFDTQSELPVQLIKNLRPTGVIISDYGKGSITYEVIEAIAKLNVPTFIDSKRNPRDFDIIMHPYFFPNEKEYSTYLTEYKLQPEVIRKRGPLGIEHQRFGKVFYTLPSFAERVTSVCGAGDTVVAAYAYRFFNCVDTLEPLEFANAAAAVVVGKPYTAVASYDEIKSVMEVKVKHLA